MKSDSLLLGEKKRGVCYLTLFNMKVQGIPKDTTYNVENIRVEMIYGKQRCLSRITTDLSKTLNREQMEDMFRIALDDISISRIPEQKIKIKVFDIDFASNFDNNLT